MLNFRHRLRRSGWLQPVLLLLLLFLLQWLALFIYEGPTWDAAFYYAQTRSLVFDQDLALENDLQLSYPTASPDFAARALHDEQTIMGRVATPYAIGSPLLWTPLMALARPLLQAASSTTLTGYEWPLRAVLAAFSALTAFFAFVVAYRLACREAGRRSALLATATLMFATPLLYYQFREPLYSHSASALASTLAVYAWWHSYRHVPSGFQALLVGGLIGAAALVRWQNLMYLALPVVSTGWAWLDLPPEQRRRQLLPAGRSLLLVGGAAITVFSMQLVIWQLFYGSWLTVPQGGAYVDWSAPFWRQVLFSPFRGLLPWLPVFFLALLGLLLLGRRKPRLVLPLLLLLLLETYVNASTRDWFGGGGFGPRRYTSELALLVLGYAALLETLAPKIRTAVGVALGILLGVHQWLLLRFGLAERWGGRVLSMYPDYRWEESAPAEFAGQLLGRLDDVLRHPLDFLALPGSPLSTLIRDGQWPIQSLLALLGAAVFVMLTLGLTWLVGQRLAARRQSSLRWLLLLGAVLLIVGFDLWVLLAA